MRLVTCLMPVVFMGCNGAIWDTTAVPPPSVPQGPATKVAQYCTFYGSADLGEINEFLRRQGEAGWQLVALGGQRATVYCFRRPLPAP